MFKIIGDKWQMENCELHMEHGGNCGIDMLSEKDDWTIGCIVYYLDLAHSMTVNFLGSRNDIFHPISSFPLAFISWLEVHHEFDSGFAGFRFDTDSMKYVFELGKYGNYKNELQILPIMEKFVERMNFLVGKRKMKYSSNYTIYGKRDENGVDVRDLLEFCKEYVGTIDDILNQTIPDVSDGGMLKDRWAHRKSIVSNCRKLFGEFEETCRKMGLIL